MSQRFWLLFLVTSLLVSKSYQLLRDRQKAFSVITTFYSSKLAKCFNMLYKTHEHVIKNH